jgi:hypothetical protein
VRSSVLFSVCLIVALALAASGLAFVGGKAVADPAGQYERGVAAGERLGRQQTLSGLTRGDERYEAIFARGREAGLGEGRRAGRADGLRTGRARGRESAFGTFSGGWRVGRWYVVSISRGDDGARYGIGARVAVERGRWYGLCRREEICERRPTRRREASTASP